VADGAVELRPPGADPGETVRARATAGPVTVVVDADLVELYDPSGSGVIARRWRQAPERVAVRASGPAGALAYPLVAPAARLECWDGR